MRYFFVVLLAFLSFPVMAQTSYSRELEEIFSRLDEVVSQHDMYRIQKEERISRLKESLGERNSLEELYHANSLLYEEYYVYNADSAMDYVDKNIQIAVAQHREDRIYDWRIKKSFQLSVVGLLKQAEDELKGIPVKNLPNEVLTDYYGQMMYLWSHYGQFTGSDNEVIQRDYLDREIMYRDSIYQVIQPSHPLYLWYKGCNFQVQGEEAMRKVIPELKSAVDSSSLNSRYDAMNAYILGSIYRDLNDMDNYMKYLAYSAIADVVSCNKDIASLEELGAYLFELGDVPRSYAYVNYCLNNAVYFKNRVRIAGIAMTINKIHAEYQKIVSSQESRIRHYLLVVSLLSIILLIAIAYIYQKLRQLAISRSKLHEMNEVLNHNIRDLSEAERQLKEANEKLHSLNGELKDVNDQLRESNYVKEEYIGYVFSLCSNYISKLDEYRKNINRKIKAKQIDEAKALTDTPTMAHNELKEFYRNFDAIFLHVYPDFVSDFNALLRPEEQIVLKSGELLNTELRIYALVRLGINDSVKIAEFLHCSPQTVYNNRMRVRNKAIIPKEKFAETVRSLGKKHV